MAILESCCGSGLAVSSAVLGVYLLVAYTIAFAVELWWILESPVTPPIPAYLLCLGYFILLAFSVLLLQGLSMKRTSFLLIWLFMMGILLGPEAGLVLYLSIHYWRVTSLYGLIEVTCWACRLVVNGIGLLCVQSLHSIWREEKSVLLRLETLKTSPLSDVEERKFKTPTGLQGHKNSNYDCKEVSYKEKRDNDSHNIFQSSLDGALHKDQEYESNFIDARYAIGSEFSEFNASSFDPAIIDSRLENMPYLTIRKQLKQVTNISDSSLSRKKIPKVRSLIDFTNTSLNEDYTKKQKPIFPCVEEKGCHSQTKLENATSSLDRKIIKNKNLKILRGLSPFCSKKPLEINIYQVNPPNDLNTSNLDSQLNQVYSTRGKYTFDEKLKKVVYYPPEYFNNSVKFRHRIDSYESNQSRSSVDTDSEDIRHIRDVAL